MRPRCDVCLGRDSPDVRTWLGGTICEACWAGAASTATSDLIDRVRATFPGRVGTLTASRAIVQALPDVDARTRAALDLGRLLAGGGRRTGYRPIEVMRLIEELHRVTVTGRPCFYWRPNAPDPRRDGICTQCGKHRQLHGHPGDEHLCAACWQRHPAALRPCRTCSQLAYLGWGGLCTPCRASERLEAMFSDATIKRLPQLSLVRDRLRQAEGRYLASRMHRVNWRRLTRLLAGPFDHESLDRLGTPQQTQALRVFLVACGALPPRDERLHALESWVEHTAAIIPDPAARGAFVRYARWRHLRAARTVAMTSGQAAGWRRELVTARRLIDWLEDAGTSVAAMRQEELDTWLTVAEGARDPIAAFIRWLRASGTNATLMPPARRPRSTAATPAMTEATRLAILTRLLDPSETIAPEDRLAGGLVLLYGVRPHRIAGLPASAVVRHDERIGIRIGREPLLLPEPLAGYALAAAVPKRVHRFGGATVDGDWLFPSPLHERPITPDSLATRLRRLGIDPKAARSTAIAELGLRVPPAVLSRLIGVTSATATRWGIAVVRAQADYAAAISEGAT